MFGPNDLVLTLGQDGLIVNTAKYLNGQPIFAVREPFASKRSGASLVAGTAAKIQLAQETTNLIASFDNESPNTSELDKKSTKNNKMNAD